MMTSNYRIVVAQLNPNVGDIEGNQQLIADAIVKARDELQAQCVVFPELALTGYPPEDLLLRPSFVSLCQRALQELAAECYDITAVIGAPVLRDNELYNSACIFINGQWVTTVDKQCLPNYGVFDEQRYFSAGGESGVIELSQGLKAGVTICEDIWCPGPTANLAERGANIIINLNASPFHLNKQNERKQTLRERIDENSLSVLYVNQVGGQDELVFDGASMLLNEQAEVVWRADVFDSCLYSLDIQITDSGLEYHARSTAKERSVEESFYQALVCGVRDYVNKNGFSGVVLGLSGGIDSALTLAIATDALGPERISAIMMPSRYTADISLEDAQEEAELLGVDYQIIPIEAAFKAFNEMLSVTFSGAEKDVTEENLQARIRGVVLMAISNKTGRMVLTTGNKSEMAVGYATLYGDMAGGFAPLKDVYKMMVYRLARYRNTLGRVIPERVIDRPPTAELAHDQKDQDSLPSYDVLDEILQRYIERNESIKDIIFAGYQAETVHDVVRRVDMNEYKRRQAPPGIKLTDKAFGRDRRYPITSGYVTCEIEK